MNRCGHDKDIRDLSVQDAFGATDIVPVYSGTNRDDRGVTGQAILNYVTANSAAALAMVTQYSAPSASPFTATVAQAGGVSLPVWLIITPTGGMANGTIALPPAGAAVDRQEVLINTTQAITALAVTATGLAVTGAPVTLAQYGVLRMRFDAVTSTWYKV